MAQKNENQTPEDELTEEDRTLAADSVVTDDEESEDITTAATDDEEEVLVTREGLKKLKEELVNLEGTKRKEVAARLKEAISYGDLSENSEYEEAKNEQAFVEGRIIELTAMIKNAKIITEKAGGKSKKIKIGSTATIENLTDKDEAETYTIVGSTEADPAENKISNESPIGAALIDAEQGDEVEVEAPAGKFKYKIKKVA